MPIAPFLSANRRYICRSFSLNAREAGTPPFVALLIERFVPPNTTLLEVTRRFRLTPRECETVVHLTRGLTTKEIAPPYEREPEQVKQFVRLTMTKMGVTTRSGIIGNLLSA